MTGKRPRALTRTASVSQLSSGSLSQQEFSPLLENPKEKLKATSISGSGSGSSSPRVVIGFDPKPCLEVASAPCSPSFNDKASSPRSVLNSLFSRQPRTKPTTTEGVGLGIVLHAPEEISVADHIAIPVRDEISVPVVHSRRHSHPIPTPGISPCHSQCVADIIVPKGGSKQRVPILGWLDHDVLKVDRRDTFLLAPSPARDVAAAFTASASHFLDECSFCKRHLPKDKDIFMYR